MKLGVLCGMAAEAAALGPLAARGAVTVAVTGARVGAAARAAASLAAEADVLISWGIAGGLRPDLATGRVIVADRVVAPDGQALPADPGLSVAVSAVQIGGEALIRGDIAGADQIVLTPEAKAALHRATGAGAVDMESHHLARAAAEAGRPFIAVRVISDPASRRLPSLAAVGLTETGQPAVARVLVGLLRRPGALPGLLAAKADSDRALARLRALAEAGVLSALIDQPGP